MLDKLKSSLLARTLLALLVAVFLFVAATATAVFRNARDEALADQDLALYDVAVALARADVSSVLPSALTMDPERFQARMESAEPLPRERGMRMGMMGMGMGMRHRHRMMMEHSDEEAPATAEPPVRRTVITAGEPVLVRFLSRQGQARAVTFPEALTEGFSTVTIDGAAHRLCVIFLPNGRYTAVAEPVKLQEAVVEERAVAAVTPLLLLMPVLGLILSGILWQAFRPLKRVAEEARSRDVTDLTPLSSDGVPSEVMPLVDAVNELLARVDAARTREIRFTADAAHELRSPLTSLTIEAEHLAKMPLSTEAHAIVQNLESGLSRAVHQVSQLLLFARAQAGETRDALTRDSAPWHFTELVGELLEPMLNTMDEKRIVFEASGLDDAALARPVAGLSRTAAAAILRNLLENAVRYSPAGGRILLSTEKTDDTLTCTVIDDGPGIAPEERDRVFDPFYRIAGMKVPGTGLGLAIVKTYADMIGAEVTLEDARMQAAADEAHIGRGLAARVRFRLSEKDAATKADQAH